MDVEHESAPAADVETPAEPIAVDAPEAAESAPDFDIDAHLTERAGVLAEHEADNAMRALHGPDYADKAAE